MPIIYNILEYKKLLIKLDGVWKYNHNFSIYKLNNKRFENVRDNLYEGNKNSVYLPLCPPHCP